MNIETIARKLNLSASTVSRALRDCDGVNPRTRKRVIKRAGELGYRLPELNKPHGVALLIPGSSIEDAHELAHRYMVTIGSEVSKLGWQLYMLAVPSLESSAMDDKSKWPKALFNEQIDCCITIDMVTPKARKLLAEHFSQNVVMISRFYLEDGISGVAIADYDSGRLCVDKLLERGHTKFGWIGSYGSYDISKKRFFGAADKLLDHNLDFSTKVWLREADGLDVDMVNNIMTAALPEKREDWPTAWIASNDWLGAKVILWLESIGMKCPDDFSMICFDDTKIAETLAQRKLTSIVSPSTNVAAGAVKMLVSRWKGETTEPNAWVYPTSFREGETLGDKKA